MKYLLYVVRRLVQLIPVLFGISLLVFFLLKIVPGDPAVTLLGSHVTDAGVAALHQQLGLDHPLWQQYFTFLGRLVHGDLGESYQYQSSVSSLVFQNLVPTIWLVVTGALFAVIITVPLAVWAASHRNGVGDNTIRTIPLIGLGMPAFWLGIMLVLLLSLKAGAFPASGFVHRFANHVKPIILPGVTVALALVPILVHSFPPACVAARPRSSPPRDHGQGRRPDPGHRGAEIGLPVAEVGAESDVRDQHGFPAKVSA